MTKSNKKILTELNDNFLIENKIVFKKYKPIKEIGTGTFGKVYSTIRLEDKSVFAMKTEKRNTYNNILETEAYYLLMLKGLGIPELISYGKNSKYNILIETLLDKSLFDLFLKPKKLCNISDLCLIALQLIDRLEFIHSKDIIYRDVKPENFMIGINDPNVIYIIDYGLCKKYRSSKTGKHIQPKYIKKFIGTLKYASINVIKGKESSRRDDLISLGFVLIHLYKRNLPWNTMFQNLDRIGYLNLLHSKETFDDGKLFHHLPEEMVDFLKYVNHLRFEQDPNYSFMKGCFQNILTRLNFNKNNINFSWINPKDNKLLPKINLDIRESSKQRILKSLENNQSKNTVIESDNNISDNNQEKKSENSTIDTDNNNISENDININPRENGEHINNNFDKNKIEENKGVLNKVLKKQTNNNNESIINIENKTNIKEKIITNNNIYLNINNNNFCNNINLRHDLNNMNRNMKMNYNISYLRKINTFAPENIIDNKISTINNELYNRDNYNNDSNKKYLINKNKNLIIIKNSIINNKMFDVINTMNGFNVNNNKF